MENKNISWEDLKVYFDESWWEDIKKFYDLGGFFEIFNHLKKDRGEGKTVLPSSNIVFRAFKETKLNELNVVFLGLSPYFIKGVADGLSFSCSNTMKEQPSLKVLLDACEDNLEVKGSRNPDLKRWAKQGILLLNSSLTTLENDARVHLSIWQPFIKFIWEEILAKKDVFIVYFGKDAQFFQKFENNERNISIFVNHPSYFARNNSPMEHKSLFSKINTYLKNSQKQEIIWIEDAKKDPSKYKEFI